MFLNNIWLHTAYVDVILIRGIFTQQIAESCLIIPAKLPSGKRSTIDDQGDVKVIHLSDKNINRWKKNVLERGPTFKSVKIKIVIDKLSKLKKNVYKNWQKGNLCVCLCVCF